MLKIPRHFIHRLYQVRLIHGRPGGGSIPTWGGSGTATVSPVRPIYKRNFLCYISGMGQLRNDAWSRLDLLIEEIGEDGLLDDICSRIAIGESPMSIYQTYGILPHCMKKWLEGDGKRVEMVELAKRCLADKLQWDGIEEAIQATEENLGVARYRTDTFMKAAKSFDKVAYGDRVVTQSVGGMLESLQVVFVQAPQQMNNLQNLAEIVIDVQPET